MKKSMYLLAMLMLGLSCALWTGCSDDDDDNGNGGGNGGGDNNVPATVVKSVFCSDAYNDTYQKIEWNYDVTTKTLKSVKVTPCDEEGQASTFYKPVEYSVNFATDKVVVNYEEWEENYRITYTLDKGKIVSALEEYVNEDGTTDEDGIYAFTYSGDKIAGITTREEIGPDEFNTVSLFQATYTSGEKNFISITSEMGDMSCDISGVENNYSVDLNFLLSIYGEEPVVNIAYLCGLVPNTTNIIKALNVTASDEGDEEEMRRLTKAAETMTLTVVVTENPDKTVKTLSVKMPDDSVYKGFSFTY